MLTEEIFEAINEELGISDEVAKEAYRISDIVLKNTEKQEKKRICPGVFTNTFRFSRKVFDETVNFVITNTYFSDSKLYFAYRKKYPKRANSFNHENATISIQVDYINGWHDMESLEGALQHELEHIFQNVNAGYAPQKTKQYKLASANYANKDSVISLVSRIVYFSEEREIFAFANQAYQALMDRDSSPREDIENTKLYFAYKTLKKGVDFLEKSKDNKNIDNLLSKFDTTTRKLLEHCQWAVKECAKYIGRVIVKSEKDKLTKGLEEGVEYNFV